MTFSARVPISTIVYPTRSGWERPLKSENPFRTQQFLYYFIFVINVNKYTNNKIPFMTVSAREEMERWKRFWPSRSNKCLIVWNCREYLRIYYCKCTMDPDPKQLIFPRTSPHAASYAVAMWIWHAEGLRRQYIKCFHLIPLLLPSSVQLNYFELCYCWFFTAVEQQQCPAFAFFMPARSFIIHQKHFFNWIFHKCRDRRERFILIIIWRLLDHFSHTRDGMTWNISLSCCVFVDSSCAVNNKF